MMSGGHEMAGGKLLRFWQGIARGMCMWQRQASDMWQMQASGMWQRQISGIIMAEIGKHAAGAGK